MRRHMKRHEAPKTWPIPRKGTTFVITNNSKGLPLLIALRDVLGLAQNRRELKKAIHNKDLMVSSKLVDDDKKSMELFDILTIVPEKKSYQLTLSNKGKYTLEEINEKDTKTKVTKIVGKKRLSGKKTQINLLDGRNYLSEIKCNVNDSVIVDLEKNEISKVLPLKEKSDVLVIGGKHAGAKGKITQIVPEFKLVEMEADKEKFNVLIKHLMVLD